MVGKVPTGDIPQYSSAFVTQWENRPFARKDIGMGRISGPQMDSG